MLNLILSGFGLVGVKEQRLHSNKKLRFENQRSSPSV